MKGVTLCDISFGEHLGKVKRYEYIFTWYVGDHLPVHLHVYQDGKLVCRWMLFEDKELSGHAPKKVRRAIDELKSEGAFRSLIRVYSED